MLLVNLSTWFSLLMFTILRMPMGMQLLRKLGWRDGQGVGPRTKDRRRRKRTGGFISVTFFRSSLTKISKSVMIR